MQTGRHTGVHEFWLGRELRLCSYLASLASFLYLYTRTIHGKLTRKIDMKIDWKIDTENHQVKVAGKPLIM
jgi:hypothetical protein